MLFTATVIVNLLLIIGVLFVIFVLLLPVVMGAPYVPTGRTMIERMLALVRVKPGERAVDLGSGDGRIVIALAQAGAEAHGYEINPILVWISRRNIRRAGLKDKAFIHWQSFRRARLASFPVVTIYGLRSIMAHLEPRLQAELPPEGRVASYTFQFPNWQASQYEQGVYLYKRSF